MRRHERQRARRRIRIRRRARRRVGAVMAIAAVAARDTPAQPKAVLEAVALGVPLPLCSCGVIPAGLGLKKDGATNGASVT